MRSIAPAILAASLRLRAGEMRRERDAAVSIWDDPAVSELAPQILDHATRSRLPTIVDAGSVTIPTSILALADQVLE